jgi:hypothetical protein
MRFLKPGINGEELSFVPVFAAPHSEPGRETTAVRKRNINLRCKGGLQPWRTESGIRHNDSDPQSLCEERQMEM